MNRSLVASVGQDRAALRPSEAIGLLIAARGRAFDPAVVDAFVALNTSGELGASAVPAS